MRVARLPVLILAVVGVAACERAEPRQAPTRCQGPPPWPGSNPLHEPPGFQMLTDHDWNRMIGGGWNYLRRTSSKNADICVDPAAPGGPTTVLRIIFTPDMRPNTDPGVHWFALPFARSVYAAWTFKLSPNWTTSPAGGGKISFLHTPDAQVYINVGGNKAPHRINVNTEWDPYGQEFWEPNVTTTAIGYDRWYRIEWYLQWESRPGAGDGVIRWWVDGVLNGDYRTVRFPFDGFTQFEYAPTLQDPPPHEQYMYIGHTYLSVPGAPGAP